MPVLDVRVLSHGASLVLLPESATIRITAVDADGPRKRLQGADFVFARTAVIEVRDGKPVRDIDLRPTDGTFCYEVRITSTVGGFKLARHITVPDAPGPIRLGDRPDVDPKTFQPTADVVAAWEGAVSDAVTARDGAVSARVAADAAATTASTAATTATAAKTSATASASSAATSAGDAGSAAVLAGSAATAAGVSATAADASARDAAASATGALQSKTAAGTSAAAAEASRVTAGEHSTSAAGFADEAQSLAGAASADRMAAASSATAADSSASSAAASATAASGSATTAGQRATDAATSATAAAASATDATTAHAGAVAARTAAETARDESGAARTGAETAKTAAETAQTGAASARTGSESARDLAQQYRDQALAGQMLGTAITSAADLNTFQTPGRFRFSGGATTSANLPVAKPGVLDVRYVTGSTNVQQEYRPFSSVAGDRVGFWQRSAANSSTSWDPWVYFTPLRTSTPANQPGTEATFYDSGLAKDTGFQLLGFDLGTFDLNTAVIPGVYQLQTATNATLARNYPRAGVGGILEVLRLGTSSGGRLLQRYTVQNGDAVAKMQGFYQRRMWDGSWDPWVFIPSQIVDETVGRRIFTFDQVNNRPQMIYGDTGWRDITSLLATGWTGQLRIRRTGYRVAIRGTIVRNDSTTAEFLPYISGFKAYAVDDYGVAVVSSASRLITGSSTGLSISASVAGSTANRIISDFDTVESWPAALPGTPLGAIPAT